MPSASADGIACSEAGNETVSLTNPTFPAFSGREPQRNEPRPDLSGPKVSLASLLRWGTEAEGWYVDPLTPFDADVNYSLWSTLS
jgi:hypothetical protein